MEVEYLNDVNMSIYADLEEVEYMEALQVEKREGGIYLLFYGYLMPPFEEVLPKFYLLWIRMLDELLR